MGDFVEAFDQLMSGSLHGYLSLSRLVGGPVQEQADLVNEAFQAEREILLLAQKCKKPSNESEMQQLIKPVSDKIVEIQNHRNSHRNSEFFNFLSSVSESITALGWIVVTPDPSNFAKELHGAAAYYGNKVITEYKTARPTYTDWAKTWLNVLSELHGYIRQHHRCGLSWNVHGSPATTAAKMQEGSAPPPPPPPPPPAQEIPVQDANGGDPRAALFKEINQGADITKCLRKVDKTSTPDKSARNVAVKALRPEAGQLKQKKPPKFALDGRKWCVEFQERAELTIPDATMNQCVSLYQCDGCFVTVDKKVNCITLDSCKKTSVMFTDVVSYVEFINCQDVKAQTQGKLPTIMIDKTDGIQLFLSEQALDVEVISSKSSEVNICVPKDDDYVEYAVPEQFKTTVIKDGLKTSAIEKV